jgi:hypothetical protein
MRIAGTHHRATILEDLDVINEAAAAKVLVLLGPNVYYTPNLRARHGADREVVPRREADDAAYTPLAASHYKPAVVDTAFGCIRQKRGIIVVEDERAIVLRIRSPVARTFPGHI